MKKILARALVLLVLTLGLFFVGNPSAKGADGCQSSAECCLDACDELFWSCQDQDWGTDCGELYTWCTQNCFMLPSEQ